MITHVKCIKGSGYYTDKVNKVFKLKTPVKPDSQYFRLFGELYSFRGEKLQFIPYEIENPSWHEINGETIKTYQLGDEPHLIHIIRVRDDEYMVVHQDAYDLETGKVEHLNRNSIKEKYNLSI